MIYVEAPDPEVTWPMLFLAGGITGCADWQSELVDYLDTMDLELIVCNPRRNNFPIDDPQAAPEQITWEHQMLKKADIISFWFPAESICPITLFELGKHMHQFPLVGVEPGYSRHLDIEIQTQLEFGVFNIYTDLYDLALAIQQRVWGLNI